MAATLVLSRFKIIGVGIESWLNQIEIWFSILVRRLLKHASFNSTEELKQRLLDFIEYFNRTMARPFQWKYKGQAQD
jgi:putative transposase